MYVDESGRPELKGFKNNTHFVLTGLAIPISVWHQKTAQITNIKKMYGLEGKEIHTAWMARKYLEQKRVDNFQNLDYEARRLAVLKEREKELRIAVEKAFAGIISEKSLRSKRKNYKNTVDYIHLTFDERQTALNELADLIGSWSDCRLFAEAVDKSCCSDDHSVFKESFTQVVTRFQAFLVNYGRYSGQALKGLVVQDDNKTEAKRLTRLMKSLYKEGTFWRDIDNIIETPLFVDSSLTEMVQMADLCAYATRRFFEYNNTQLFNKIYPRFDRAGNLVVGIRHYTGFKICACKVCQDHGRSSSWRSK